jgi:hypothetical protein
MQRKRWLWPALLVATLAIASRAHAAPFVWTFSAEVVLVSGSASEIAALESGGVVPGAAVTGFVVLESTVADADPDPLYGSYAGGVTDFEVVLPALLVDFEASGLEVVALNVEGGGLPFVYAAQAQGNDSTAAFADVLFSLELVDSSNSAFAGDALPLTPPLLAALDPYSATQAEDLGFTTRLNLGFGPTARVDAVLLTLVPEPGSFALLAAGAALATLSRRVRRS